MSMGGGEPDSQNDELIPTPPMWVELPRDVTANILRRLGALEILDSVENVCTTWRRICADPAMWRVLHIDYTFAPYARRAVDHSQGQLLDLRIQSFCGDNLLIYTADRSIGLKRLAINGTNATGITREGLNEAIKKLAHLEELELVLVRSVQAEDIINIGISCPKLKSFTFNVQGFSHPYSTYFAGPISNEYALAIAGNMPNLCHLCLNANPIGNEGLEAILDGCPRLESLDLRQCFGLNLHGALSKRCSEQIKLLKLPLDPVSFIEYHDARAGNCYMHDDDVLCYGNETFSDYE